jgi:sugar O-acyltransferase (sialic acid O-acetyltransferase NeuD family)
MKEPLVLVGGGGHCRACIDVIEAEGRYAIAGVVDAKAGDGLDGYPWLGDDAELPRLVAAGNRFLVTVGQIRDPAARVRLHEVLRAAGAALATVIAPTAHVSRRARVGEGTIIMHQALVNAGAAVGSNCIVNTKALVEHDASVGDHCHVSTAAVLNGGASLGERGFLGSGSVVHQGVRIPPGCVIGAGTVLRRAPTAAGTWAGDPPVRVGGPR